MPTDLLRVACYAAAHAPGERQRRTVHGHRPTCTCKPVRHHNQFMIMSGSRSRVPVRPNSHPPSLPFGYNFCGKSVRIAGRPRQTPTTALVQGQAWCQQTALLRGVVAVGWALGGETVYLEPYSNRSYPSLADQYCMTYREWYAAHTEQRPRPVPQ